MKIRIKIDSRDPLAVEITDVDTGEDVLLSDFVLEVQPMEPIIFRAGLYGDHVDLNAVVEVGTLSSFTDDELNAEGVRRCLDEQEENSE